MMRNGMKNIIAVIRENLDVVSVSVSKKGDVVDFETDTNRYRLHEPAPKNGDRWTLLKIKKASKMQDWEYPDEKQRYSSFYELCKRIHRI